MIIVLKPLKYSKSATTKNRICLLEDINTWNLMWLSNHCAQMQRRSEKVEIALLEKQYHERNKRGMSYWSRMIIWDWFKEAGMHLLTPLLPRKQCLDI